jgi:gliding motility-associated-like protein
MRFFYNLFLVITLVICQVASLSGQVANDNCATAKVLTKVNDYCEDITTRGATPNPLSAANCWTTTGADIWYSFVAIATEVSVTVRNKTTTSTPSPETALYATTDCTTYSELYCGRSNNGASNIIKGGLIPGERYFIRIQSANNTTADFRLCINNYNPPAQLSSDCPQGAVLCDKSGFSIPSLKGAGTNVKELTDATCWGTTGGGLNPENETNSTWLKWTCQQSGTLTFSILPLNITDDIDFALYELPNGLNNCTGKRLVRCMAAGPNSQNNPNPNATDRRCFGATGLNLTAQDVNETSGCTASDPHDNFLKALDMEAGKTYALCINNFEGSGFGTSISFGGTGTFVGPDAKISLNKPDKKYCLGEDVVFIDASTFANGQITKRQWKFGKDASRDSASSATPSSYRVFYKTPGWKAVVLTVTTDRGCIVTSIIDSIFIEGFKYDSTLRRPTCELGTDGLIKLRVVNCGRAPIRYNWDNTGYSTRDSLAGLSSGRHRVLITDSSGMHVDTFSFNLKQFEVELDTAKRIVTPPTCFGLSNGKIELKPATGIAPFLYKWNNSTTYLPDNTLTSLSEGQYTVEIRDANNCKGVYTFNVAAPPRVSVAIDSFNITCFGLTDGAAIAYPAGGVGKYKVTWSTGTVGDTVRNLKAGTYSLIARDSNACETTRSVTIIEPGQIGLAPIRIQPAKCFGDSTAELVVLGSGGTPPFRYSIDGIRFQRDSAFFKIPSKSYTVVVRDSTGCRRTVQVDVPQPPQIQVTAGADITVQLGFSTDIRATVIPSSKLVSYVWTPKDSSMACATCPRTSVGPFNTTKYRVTVKDSSGCTAFDELIVNVDKKRPVFIPTAFSPNGDGINDYFSIFANQSALVIKELRIFNRWGDMLFVGKDLPLNNETKGWDGTFNDIKLNPDVFAFFAIVKFIDGEEIVYKGDITLMK